MKRSIHAFMGASAGILLSLKQGPHYVIPCAVLGWLGGWFPDIDLRLRHRRSLHNIFAAIGFSVIVYMVLSYIAEKILGLEAADIDLLTISFTVGWLLHVLMDSLTVMGVYVLWPFSRYRFRLAEFKSESKVLNVFGLTLSLIMIILWVLISWKIIKIL